MSTNSLTSVEVYLLKFKQTFEKVETNFIEYNHICSCKLRVYLSGTVLLEADSLLVFKKFKTSHWDRNSIIPKEPSDYSFLAQPTLAHRT
jgi:hypothetical protein